MKCRSRSKNLDSFISVWKSRTWSKVNLGHSKVMWQKKHRRSWPVHPYATGAAFADCILVTPLPIDYTETVWVPNGPRIQYLMMVDLKYIFGTAQSSCPNENGSHRFSVAMWVTNHHGRASFTSAGDEMLCVLCLSRNAAKRKDNADSHFRNFWPSIDPAVCSQNQPFYSHAGKIIPPWSVEQLHIMAALL